MRQRPYDDWTFEAVVMQFCGALLVGAVLAYLASVAYVVWLSVTD